MIIPAILEDDFKRLTYTEAIDILHNSKPNKKKKFQYPIEGFGTDLQSEHERYLVEKHFKKPVILTDYPKNIKAFYMKQNDDGKTVRAMDVLVPRLGEIIGGNRDGRTGVAEHGRQHRLRQARHVIGRSLGGLVQPRRNPKNHR